MLVKQRLISADSHVTILDDDFLAHVPTAHKEVAEGFVAEARAALLADELAKQVVAAGVDTVRNWPAQGRPGDHDQVERLKDQDADGVDAEVLYSQSTVGIDGGPFYQVKDRNARVALFRAYNDTLAEWIAAAPDRLVPVGIIPVAEPADGVAEIERLAGLGFRAATVPSYPDVYGLDPYYRDSYQDLWRAFASHQIPVSLHTGSTRGLQLVKELDPTPAKGIYQSLPPMHMAELISTWILGGMLPRNPDLHLVLVESGIGWIAYYLDRLDGMFHRHNWPNRGMIQELPSTYWDSQCHATFEEDLAGMKTLDRIGVDKIMWASDYPHPDSTWPESQKVVDENFADLSDDIRHKIVWENAATLYRLG
jgi:predicted TIM-barrel fold metal-dependent hydrolase